MGFFSGKVAIITGAGSGIGRALSRELARRGSHVVISDINKERIESVGKQIEESGDKVTTLTLNVSDYEAVKKMVDDTVAEHGRIDYIFNNAGIAVGGEARDLTIKDWHDVLDVNLYGVINGVATAYPIMAKQGFGHIINTASIEGLAPFPGTISYVASKYAVVGLSNSLRIEGARLGVKVSAVCPGYIKTAIFEESKMVNMDRERALDAMTKAPGFTPEECANVILKGVERNKAIIPVHWVAYLLWYIARLSPRLIMFLMRVFGERMAKEGRLEEDFDPGS